MTPHCRNTVSAAAGRALTDAEVRKIDDRLSATMRRLARTDPNWQGMTRDARVMAASEQAMRDVVAEAQLKVTRANLQALRTVSTDGRISDLMGLHSEGRSHALVREIEQTGTYIEGIKRESLSQLMDLLNAAESREGASPLRRGLMFLFDADNPAMTRDLAVEIIGNANGSTRNATAQAGARAWLSVIESLRKRFNDAGGDVGKVDYGYLPQPHDTAKVRGAGNDSARDAWANAVMPLLDRSQYLREDGARMADAEVLQFLREAWSTIATDGLNKTQPGARPAPGSGAKANAGSQSRQIHFRDGDAYLRRQCRARHDPHRPAQRRRRRHRQVDQRRLRPASGRLGDHRSHHRPRPALGRARRRLASGLGRQRAFHRDHGGLQCRRAERTARDHTGDR